MPDRRAEGDRAVGLTRLVDRLLCCLGLILLAGDLGRCLLRRGNRVDQRVVLEDVTFGRFFVLPSRSNNRNEEEDTPA